MPASSIDGASIHIGSAIQKQLGRFDVAVFGGDVQQGRALERQSARPRAAAEVEFGESSVNRVGIGVEMLGQSIEPTAKDVQQQADCRAASFRRR